MTQTATKTADFSELHARAHAAGHAAATGTRPEPMIVGSPTTLFGNDIDYTKKFYYESEGTCGFAWISFAGNKPFGRWAKKAGLARSHYPSGLCIWVSDYGQSVERKSAYAGAYAKVLREAGVEAHAGDRMD